MLDPLALSASRRHSPLFHEAFTEVTGSGGTVTSNGSTRANMSVDARGLGLAPIPFAFTAGASHFGLRNVLDDVEQLDSLHAAIGSQPTPDTSLVIQFSGARRTNRLALATDEQLINSPSDFPLDLTTQRYRRVNSRDISTLAVLSHDLGMLRLSAGGLVL